MQGLVGMKYVLLVALGVTLAAPAFTTSAFAQEAPPYPVPAGNPATQNNGDPQARVGRISLIDGTVSFHTPDQDSWAYATLNYPVVSGHAFWTEPNSRAEIQVGDAALRLDASTEVDINELDDAGFRIEVLQGSVNLHVGSLSQNAAGQSEVYQVITPHDTVNILQPGTYRVNTATNNVPDEVSVLRGRAQVGDANAAVTLTSGETAIVPADNVSAMQVAELAPTDFDNWSLARDNFEEPRQVAHYISPQMTGYEDLDANGTWSVQPGYGAVWMPNAVPAGWQPYHYGHWVWVSPWGWTWVDQAPWGFAPFHYGRWAYINNHWGWAPGAIEPRPVYAPALVAFVGGGGLGLSIGIGGGPVGWFPLGPNEIYHPAYHVSPGYIRGVNMANVHDQSRINNITVNNYGGPNGGMGGSYANRRFATVVPAQDFASGRRVDQAAIHVPQAKLLAAPVSNGAPPVQHDRGVDAANRPGFTAPVHNEAPHIAAQPDMQPHGNVVTPNASAPHDEHVVAPQAAPQQVAPGPAIMHRNTAAPVMVQGNYHLQATPAVQEPAQHEEAAHVQAHEQAVHAAPVAAAAPREIQVQHPEQRVPLTPSHQGWVRAAPQAAPAPHVETPHPAPAHAEAPHAEPAHGDDHPGEPGR